MRACVHARSCARAYVRERESVFMLHAPALAKELDQTQKEIWERGVGEETLMRCANSIPTSFATVPRRSVLALQMSW